MGSARRLLLVAALALAIAADARTEATLSTLTLSPDAGSLITTRDGSTSTSTTKSTTGVIGSAASDSNKVTKTPATETPATEAPATEAPATTAPPPSDSGSTSTSDSGDQETTEAPSSPTATVSPGSTSDRSSTETNQSETAATSSSTSKSSTANVDTLNDSNGTISAGNPTTGMGTILPAVFGALACVGAVVMAVTYKNKREANYANEDNRPSSDCEYASGADFTPDNRALSTVQEDTPPVSVRVPVLSSQSNSSVCSSSSPFGSARCKVRISSPVQSCYSSSETNMEFQDTAPSHPRGSNVVLTIEELSTDSSRTGPQVQL